MAEHVIAGDFNFPCTVGNAGFDIFNELASDFDLYCCDSDMRSNSNIQFTYIHEALNHASWLDHFFITAKLIPLLCNALIVDSGANLSDHLPVSCNISCPVNNTGNPPAKSKSVYKERWDLADLLGYYYYSGCLLQDIVVSSCTL